MPGMMRMTSALVFVCASFVAACSWGEGSGDDGAGGGGGVDAAVISAMCGDGVCAASEIGSCTNDCGSGGGTTNPFCGNSTCDTGETTSSCPSDCGGGGGSGSGSGSSTACPSDVQECLFCAIAGQMCPAGMDMTSCTACIGGGGGGGLGNCSGGMPNGMCDAGEDATSCPFDCQ
jgi:hypothetical protein